MENHSSVTGHQGSRCYLRGSGWARRRLGGGSTNVSCQLGLGLCCQLNDY